MNPRLRRLEADYKDIRHRFDADEHITVTPIGPLPPDKYQITYRVPTLKIGPGNRPMQMVQTTVTLTLPIGYPREKPHAVTADPVFHPNFGAYVCIADFWAPGQSLSDIIVSIGDMLQFRKYNIRSPLNAVAAEWANAHAGSLPISTIELGVPSTTVRVKVAPKGRIATPQASEG